MVEPKKFSSLSVPIEMVETLCRLGYKHMTPVQSKSLPYILDGKDVLAQAKTGSGKTAAFGVGLLSKLDVKKFDIQSLVICPTRELSLQVTNELRSIAKFRHNIKILTLCGGVAFGSQISSLKHGAHIVVGTPGRILGHLDRGSLSLKSVDTLVLDEADRMLDMGFIEDIREIVAELPRKRQILLFSATFPEEIEDLTSSIGSNPINIETLSVEPKNSIDEYFCNISKRDKFSVLIGVLNRYKPKNVIVFCNTKIQTREIAEDLRGRDIDALAIHGDLEQYERVDVLVQFINGSCRVLVATDVAARGLDIKELDMVINYELPNSPEIYTHRIGRTARAGERGLAVTLCCEDEICRLKECAIDEFSCIDSENLQIDGSFSMKPKNETLVIEGGKKNKIRPGDILGALTKEANIEGSKIGKIDIFERQSYVAIEKMSIDKAYGQLKKGKIKGKTFSVWILE